MQQTEYRGDSGTDYYGNADGNRYSGRGYAFGKSESEPGSDGGSDSGSDANTEFKSESDKRANVDACSENRADGHPGADEDSGAGGTGGCRRRWGFGGE